MGWAARQNQNSVLDFYERNGYGMLKFNHNMNTRQTEYMLAIEAVKVEALTPQEFKDMWFSEATPPKEVTVP